MRLGSALLVVAVVPAVLDVLNVWPTGLVSYRKFLGLAPSALWLMMLTVRPSLANRALLRTWTVCFLSYAAVVAGVHLARIPSAVRKGFDPCAGWWPHWHRWSQICFGGIGHFIFFCLLVPLLYARRVSPQQAMLWRLNYLWRLWRVYMGFAAVASLVAIFVNSLGRAEADFSDPNFGFWSHFELYMIAIQAALFCLVMQPRVRALSWLFLSSPSVFFERQHAWHSTAVLRSRVSVTRQRRQQLPSPNSSAATAKT